MDHNIGRRGASAAQAQNPQALPLLKMHYFIDSGRFLFLPLKKNRRHTWVNLQARLFPVKPPGREG